MKHVALALGGKRRDESAETRSAWGKNVGSGLRSLLAEGDMEEICSMPQTQTAVCCLDVGLGCTSGRQEAGLIHFYTPSAASSRPGLSKCLRVAHGSKVACERHTRVPPALQPGVGARGAALLGP